MNRFPPSHALAFLAGLSCTLALSGRTNAQPPNFQAYSVKVPQSISITGPSSIHLTHNESNSPLEFPAQTWTVRGNAILGVHVNFATTNAFENTLDPNHKRDAKLELKLGTTNGPGVWSIGTSAASTDYKSGQLIAEVNASSNSVGRADLDVIVSFLTDNYALIASGNYTTTIVGTISAN
jgi:hypothetical protein